VSWGVDEQPCNEKVLKSMREYSHFYKAHFQNCVYVFMETDLYVCDM